MWIIGRTQIDGAADYVSVNKVQDSCKVDSTPPKGTVDPSIDMKPPPPAIVDTKDASTKAIEFQARSTKNWSSGSSGFTRMTSRNPLFAASCRISRSVIPVP